MNAGDAVHALVAAGVVERADGQLRLGDQAGLLQPGNVEALARLVAERIPARASALVVGETRLDALLGFVAGRSLNLPIAMMYDREGIAGLQGELGREARACLLTGVLKDSWRIAEFVGLSRRVGAEAVGVVALVSAIGCRDDRVTALLEL